MIENDLGRLDHYPDVALAPIGGDPDDSVVGPELPSLGPRRDENRSRRRPEEQPELPAELPDGFVRLPPRHGIHLVDQVAPQQRRNEPRTDPGNPVGTGLAARKDRRFRRLHSDDATGRVLPLEHVRATGECRAGADTRHERVDAAVALLPDLVCRSAMRLDGSGIRELMEHERSVARQPFGVRDRPGHAFGRLGEDQLDPERLEIRSADLRHVRRRDNDDLVALGGADHGQRSRCVPRRRLDDRLPLREDAASFGVLDHREHCAVLDRARRVIAFNLQSDLATVRRGAQIDHHRIPDDFENAGDDGCGVLAGLGLRCHPTFPETLMVPAGPSTTRPITVPTSTARSAGHAARRPPDVWASASIRRVSSVEPSHVTCASTAARFRFVPPGTDPLSASAGAPGNSGTRAASMAAAAPEAASIRCRWPRRPNPVTSVQARTPATTSAADATSLRRVIDSTAACIASSGALSALIAVVITPVPIGLVSTKSSPGRAASIVIILDGSICPTMTIPYFGSGSSTVWPPTTTKPARSATSRPPRRTSARTSSGNASRGHAAMFRPTRGRPPIAYTSLAALVAAI